MGDADRLGAEVVSGFWLLAALYAAMWGVLLAPGAVVLLSRRSDRAVPSDDPVDEAWVPRLRRELEARAPEDKVRAADVGFSDPPSRRRVSRVPATVLRVRGNLIVPDGAAVDACLIVEGDLRCESGAHVTGPAWVRGNVWVGARARVHSLIVDKECALGPDSVVSGGVASVGAVRLDPGAEVTGPVLSRSEIVLRPNTQVASALAPVVRCELDPDQVELVPVSDARPLEPQRWTSRLDDALTDLWPTGRLAELVEALAERTGQVVRGVHVMDRARELGLYERGVPRPPAVLGRRPRWILEPQTVRVGADLRVPPGVIVSYALAVEGSLEVYQDGQLERPVRSGRGILLHARAVCYAQAVSDGLIVLEEGAAVLGPLDTSTHVLLFANASVGVPGFGGAHARGAIGLEPGARILGGAVAGVGVRGEPLRPQAQRVEQVERLPDVKDIRRPSASGQGSKKKRRGRKRKPAPEAPEQPQVMESESD